MKNLGRPQIENSRVAKRGRRNPIWTFYALQKGSYGRIGTAGFYVVLAAEVLILIWNLVFLLSGSSIEWLRSMTLLGLLVGFALYDAATLRARVLPRWCGVVFIIAFPITALLEEYGNIWFGLGWLALGYMVWSQRDTSVGQPSRVS